MADQRQFGSTSNLVRFTLKHSTTGQGLTGLSSGSASLVISASCDNESSATTYTGGNLEGITTLGTYATPTAGKCRFKEFSSGSHPGLYEFQFADARFAVASAKRLVISVTGAANLLDADYEIQLTQTNVYDAVRGGMTALPNVAAAWPTVPIDWEIIRAGTAQAGSATNYIVLDAGASATDNFYLGCGLRTMSGTGLNQVRKIAGYLGGVTLQAQVDHTFSTTPDNTTTWVIYADTRADVGLWNGAAVADPVGGRISCFVYAMAPDVITSNALATSAVNEIADGVLLRDWTITATGTVPSRCLLNVGRKLRSWSVSGLVFTVYKEDDATAAFTQVITTTAVPDAITSLKG